MKILIEMSAKLKNILNLEREPVGVKFIKDSDKAIFKNDYDGNTKTRYCQALMRAGNGESIMITSENISCPASAAAFGLKPLPVEYMTYKNKFLILLKYKFNKYSICLIC